MFFYRPYHYFRSKQKEGVRMNEKLREQVKLLKALQGITYKEIAGYLEIKQDSLYSWLKGRYDFSPERIKDLCDIVSNLKE